MLDMRTEIWVGAAPTRKVGHQANWLSREGAEMTILESCIQRRSIKYGTLCAMLLVFSFGSLAAQGQDRDCGSGYQQWFGSSNSWGPFVVSLPIPEWRRDFRAGRANSVQARARDSGDLRSALTEFVPAIRCHFQDPCRALADAPSRFLTVT